MQNRRSWVEDARLTQSQTTLGFESGGNESDNSVDDPNASALDTTLLKKSAQPQPIVQRKSIDRPDQPTRSTTATSRLGYQPLLREDSIRSHRSTLPG